MRDGVDLAVDVLLPDDEDAVVPNATVAHEVWFGEDHPSHLLLPFT